MRNNAPIEHLSAPRARQVQRDYLDQMAGVPREERVVPDREAEELAQLYAQYKALEAVRAERSATLTAAGKIKVSPRLIFKANKLEKELEAEIKALEAKLAELEPQIIKMGGSVPRRPS